jgi:hypothetical protein
VQIESALYMAPQQFKSNVLNYVLVLFKQLVYSYENGKYKVRLQSVEYSKYVAISCSTGKVYSTVRLIVSFLSRFSYN